MAREARELNLLWTQNRTGPHEHGHNQEKSDRKNHITVHDLKLTHLQARGVGTKSGRNLRPKTFELKQFN